MVKAVTPFYFVFSFLFFMALFRISDLVVSTFVGVNDWEKETVQDVRVNIEFVADISSALASDELSDSVDYKMLTKKVISEVMDSRFNLLESLAQKVLDVCLEDERVSYCKVTVDKPHSLRFSESVSVTVEGESR